MAIPMLTIWLFGHHETKATCKKKNPQSSRKELNLFTFFFPLSLLRRRIYRLKQTSKLIGWKLSPTGFDKLNRDGSMLGNWGQAQSEISLEMLDS